MNVGMQGGEKANALINKITFDGIQVNTIVKSAEPPA